MLKLTLFDDWVGDTVRLTAGRMSITWSGESTPLTITTKYDGQKLDEAIGKNARTLTSAGEAQDLQINSFTAFPTNEGEIANYRLIFTLTEPLQKGSFIGINFPTEYDPHLGEKIWCESDSLSG
jgi:hypothetical protein